MIRKNTSYWSKEKSTKMNFQFLISSAKKTAFVTNGAGSTGGQHVEK